MIRTFRLRVFGLRTERSWDSFRFDFLVVEAATTFLADFIRNFLSSLLVHARIHLISITDNFMVKGLEVVVRIGGNCSVAALKKIF